MEQRFPRKLRREERKRVMIFTPVYDFQENFLLGYLGDLTLIGALLVSEEPVQMGRNIVLAIEFREVSEMPTTRRMVISARVVWCQLEEHRTHYNAGLEFLEMSAQNKGVIDTVLKKYHFSGKISV